MNLSLLIEGAKLLVDKNGHLEALIMSNIVGNVKRLKSLIVLCFLPPPPDERKWSQVSNSWSVGATSDIKITYPTDHPLGAKLRDFDIRPIWSPSYNLTISFTYLSYLSWAVSLTNFFTISPVITLSVGLTIMLTISLTISPTVSLNFYMTIQSDSQSYFSLKKWI